MVLIEDVGSNFFQFGFVQSGRKVVGVGHVENEHGRLDGHRQVRPEREVGRARLQNHFCSQNEVEDEVGRGGHDDADESDDRADGRGHHELLLLSAHGFVASAHVEAGVGHHRNASEAEASRKGIQKRLLDPIF